MKDEERASSLLALSDVYFKVGEYRRSLEAAKEALSLWQKLGDEDRLVETYLEIAKNMGNLDRREEAVTYLEKALHYIEAGYGSVGDAALVYGIKGLNFLISGVLAQARESLLRAREMALQSGECEYIFYIHDWLARECWERGDWEGALANLLQSIDITMESGRLDLAAQGHNFSALVCLAMCDVEGALKHARKGLSLAEKSGAVLWQGYIHKTFGEIYLHLGRLEEAEGALRRSLDFAVKFGSFLLESWCLIDLGAMASDSGCYGDAVNYLKRALALAERAGPRFGPVAHCHLLLAEAYLGRGELAKSQEHISLGMAIARKLNRQRTIGGLRRVQGKLYRAEGKWKKAKKEFEASIKILQRINDRLEEARTFYEYGLMYLEKGEVERGREKLKEALEAFESLSAKAYEARVRKTLLGMEPRRVRFRIASARAPLGRPLREEERIEVIWTVDAGKKDFDLLKREGKVVLRQERILRLLEEAKAQGGAPTVRDLARALGVSAITIKRDLASLRKRGYVIKTRGTKKMIP